jgi:phytoene dehydrogenase-like protein
VEHDATMSAAPQADVIVVGGGLAGLACALDLQDGGARPLLLEAADRAGGRVTTDEVEGFLLDRGFQVLLTDYPQARARLDLEALDLRPFPKGALVRHGGRFVRIADPRSHPSTLLGTLAAPIATWGDKLGVLTLEQRLASRSEDATSELALREAGVSERFLQAFLRPFFGGVFLERELSTSARKLAFVWHHFAAGRAALPADGMRAIPTQLASRLPDGVLVTGAEVVAIDDDGVRLSDGRRLTAPVVVLATPEPVTRALLARADAQPWHGVAALSFDAEQPPHGQPWLVLDGEDAGPVNNLAVPSLLSERYAPTGRHLVVASVLGLREESDQALEAAVRRQLVDWYGRIVDGWQLLRVERIRHGVPAVAPGEWREQPGFERPRERLFVCGDHLAGGSIDGALASGGAAAAAVLATG